jgi:hypothetical protein
MVQPAPTSNWPRSRPRFATPRDPDRPSIGATTLAHLLRLRRALPYGWQSDVAWTAGELADDGAGFRYPIVVLSVPRRAGKTTVVLAANLDRMDLTGDARCWYTAQDREHAAKLFRDEWSPMLTPLSRLYRLRRSQGSEGVHKRRGSSSLQLFAPKAEALHGTNVDTATVDEAWTFDIDQGEGIESGITPAQLTRPWRQTWIVSAGGTIESTWWDRWLTAGRTLPGVAMFDYGADPTDPGYDPADPAVWARAHPTAGVAFPIRVLEQEWARRQSDAEFERSYLNVWPRPSDAAAASGIDLAAWRASAHPGATVSPATAIAFDVAADRSSASLAIAADRDGTVTVDVVDARPGVAWLPAAVSAARAAHRGARLVADSIVAASTVQTLARTRVTVEPVGAADHARACGTFIDRLGAGRLQHRAQPALDDAVLGARRRPLGDAWLWARTRSQSDISPLVAATLAVWAAIGRRPTGRPAIQIPATVSPPPGHPRRRLTPLRANPGAMR